MSVSRSISNHVVKSKFSDIELISLVRKGDKKAFELLYKRYSRFHLLTCLRYVKSKFEAQDLLQEAYILIFRDLYQFDESKGKYSNWSNRVIINVCLQYLRKKRDFVEIDSLTNTPIVLQEKSLVLDELSLRDLTAIISGLPTGYRTVFNLYVIDGYTHKEISEKLAISESTSKTQLMKARNLLQKKLNKVNHPLMKNYA